MLDYIATIFYALIRVINKKPLMAANDLAVELKLWNYIKIFLKITWLVDSLPFGFEF